MEKEATSAVCQQISDLIDDLDAFAKSAWGVKYETDLKIGLRMTLFGGGQIVITRSANGKLDVKVGRNQKGGDFLVLAQKGNVPDKKLVLVVDELLDSRSKKGDLRFAIKSAMDNSGAYDPNGTSVTAAPDFKAQLNALKPKLAQAAQQVYDKWDASDEVDGDFNVGFGGICHLIADAMAEVIEESIPGAATTTLSHDSMVHVSVVAWDEATEETQEDDDPDEPRWIDIYHVDINPYLYETGGGYNWQKIPDVQFDASFVSISRDRISPEDLEAIREG
jgi:hypothetical protein